jgi:16S rRNA C967 or C1407 C5-methylase (RsmB/RsmF family)/NOL1/NOP2/fmu family ribosome biogenesis protein
MPFPPAFEAQMQRQLGAGYADFEQALRRPPPVAIRVNPRKPFALPDGPDRVKWEPKGFYLPERPVFTLDPLFHAGAYYVQEASSMFVGEAVRQLLPRREQLRVLDLAAAPGGKSTLLAAELPSDSFLLANEVIRSRYPVLRENLTRWGYANTHTANHDARDFAGLAGWFDLVLLDAPCSGEGLFRKDPSAVDHWSPEAVAMCAARQRRILDDALPLVAPGGLLLYATCTYNESENEDNAAWIADRPGFEPAELVIDGDWPIVRRRYGYQFYPHLVRGEGFYLAASRRRAGERAAVAAPPFRSLSPLPRRERERLDDWISPEAELAFFRKPNGGILALPTQQVETAQATAAALSRLELGTPAGAFKGADFVPDHALALSTFVAGKAPAVDLSLEQALRYLKKEDPEIENFPQGWALARYRGHALGWMKGLKNRLNNYLPKEWRIKGRLAG